ncbi:MAG: glutathione peroxidase [Sporichthyaceae bacterium]
MPALTDFTARTLDGQEKALADYKDQVVLVVNTASKCGFTPQYTGLQELHESYSDQGLAVLGFPCNQFGGQEPGDAAEIGGFCQKNYGVTFQMMEKVDVNGSNAHPVFAWLRSSKRGLLGSKIRWNFTKFLIGKDGKVLARYGSTTKPEKIKADIEKALRA